MKKINKLKNPILIYTILFTIIFLAYYGIFILNNRSLIWNADGINQHFSILYDFNEMIREFIRNPSNGLAEWSWNIGYGSDIIGTYSYYVIGDPFAYLSLLFPLDKLELVYDLLIALRLYFAGFAFLMYGRRMKFSNYAIILGSIPYAFSGFALMTALRHPYFINPLILLPIAFIGIENILDNRKKYVFSIIVVISMISNFYFCYMIAIISVLYAILRYFEVRKSKNIAFIKYFSRLFLYFLIGIMISCVILLPTLYSIITSSRITSDDTQKSILLYPISYYANLLYTSISSGSYPFWTVLTFPIITTVLLPLFIKVRKKYFSYFSMFIIFSIMVLLPFFGSMMNGFSSISNRWTFAFAFVSSIIIAVCFDNLKFIGKKEIYLGGLILFCYGILGVIRIMFPKIKSQVFPSVFIGIIIILILYRYLKVERKTGLNEKKVFRAILLLVLINVIFNNFYRYSSFGNNYVKQFLKRGTAFSYYEDSFGGAEEYIKEKDTGFYRIAKADNVSRDKTRNNSFFLNYNGIDAFLSINNGYLAEFSRTLNNRAFTPNSPIINFDNRPIVSDVMGVKYYISRADKNSRINSAAVNVKDIGKYSVYENEDVLPFGYVYSSVLDKNVFDKLNGVEKEESLVYAASVDQKYAKSNINSIKSKLNEMSFEIEKSEPTIKENKIKVNKSNEKIIFKIKDNEINEGNIYLNIKNLKYKPLVKETKEDNLYRKVKGKIKNFAGWSSGDKFTISASYKGITKNFNKPDSLNASGYFEMDSALYNLGYLNQRKNLNDIIELTFKNAGEYTFDSIEIFNMPTYKDEIKKLKENSFNIEKVNNDEVLGNITSSTDGVLMFQIPYSRGWNITIDGEEVKTFPVNGAFIGCNMESGKHEIQLVYKTPFLRSGLIIAVIGIGLLIFLENLQRRNKYKSLN